MGTPMFVVKAYLPVNESFGTWSTWHVLAFSPFYFGINSLFFFPFKASLLTFVPTPRVRPSPSVCSIIGRYSLEIPWIPAASLLRLWQIHASARVSRKEFQLWITTWTNCKAPVPFVSPSSTHFPIEGLDCTEHHERYSVPNMQLIM